MRADRRRFLGWLSGASAALFGGIALVRGSGYVVSEAARARLGVLAPWQFVVVEAIGQRIVAPERADVGFFVDGFARGLADQDRDELLGLIGFVEQLAPLAVGLGPRFTQLLPDEQDRVLAWLEQNPVGLVRGGFAALKALAMMAYYRQDEAFERLGYGGPVVRWSVR